VAHGSLRMAKALVWLASIWPALSSARSGSGAFSCDVRDAPCSMSNPTQLLIGVICS
jgi:hypothetical protein